MNSRGAGGLSRQPEPEDRVFEWITDLVESGGYAGIALLMLLENVFPPIPSELIMPLAGFVAARGDLSLPLVVLAGTRVRWRARCSGITPGCGWAANG